MFARVFEITGDAKRIDDGIAAYRDLVLPALKSTDGFERAYLLVDRNGGRALSITLWGSAEAMAASDTAADGLSARVSEVMDAQAWVAHYDIAIVEPSD